MSNKLSIDNTVWTVKCLNDKIPLIIKPKFQRKLRWRKTPDKNNKNPSYSEYIKFIYKTENSVDAISFGTIIENNETYYVSIDGNNRLNAIISFVNSPLDIYQFELEDELFELKKFITQEFYENIDYDTITSFRRISDIEGINKFTDNLTMPQFTDLEKIMIKIQDKLLLNDKKKDKFTDVVKISINLFSGGSYNEYNEIFSSINKHSNELSENDLLASILYSTNITLIKNTINYEILEKIKIYYSLRDQNEILSNDVTVTIDNINIFDYFIGLQNILNDKCKHLKVYNSNGLGYIFRLYKIINSIDNICKDSFDEFDHESFTNKTIKAANILNTTFNNISDEDVNNKIYGKRGCITSIFKENTKILLLCSIISMLNKNQPEQIIVDKMSICCFYHVIQRTLSRFKLDMEDEELNSYQVYCSEDRLYYQAGGGFIDSLCKKILNKSEYLLDSISKESLTASLKLAIKYHNKPSEKKIKGSKRQTLNIFHKMLFSIIVRLTTPINMLNKRYSIEHLIPFSTKYSGKIDIDRIGNLFPIPLEYNKKRGNKSINEYANICKDYHDSTISNIISNGEYDIIVTYEGSKPHIKDIDKFDNICSIIETRYIDKCIKFLFK
jgi:hypothetical protein